MFVSPTQITIPQYHKTHVSLNYTFYSCYPAFPAIAPLHQLIVDGLRSLGSTSSTGCADLAEQGGFEPPTGFNLLQLSRLLHYHYAIAPIEEREGVEPSIGVNLLRLSRPLQYHSAIFPYFSSSTPFRCFASGLG